MANLKDQFDILLTKAGTSLRDFIVGLLEGLQYNSDQIDPFYTDVLTRSQYNSQKMVLQKALNEIFATGYGAHEIIVETNNSNVAYLYFYEPSENFPVYFLEPAEGSPVYFFEPSETPPAADFTIKIPVADYTAEYDRRITAEVNGIKLAGKSFITVTY